MNHLYTTTQALQNFRQQLDCKSIGFVPTMGNLHAGHLKLIEMCLKQCQICFVSIFVNPTQFAPGEDFDKYPRTLEKDLEKLQQEFGKESPLAIFAPQNNSEIYPDEAVKLIKMGPISQILCGRSRPTHFDGVATVVNRLFEIIQPTVAYFGKKDYQQYILIKQMVEKLKLPVQIVGIETEREASGLALSSRNQFLNSPQEALNLYQSIKNIADQVGQFPYHQLVQTELQKPLPKGSQWDYLEILDANDLSTPKESTRKLLIAGAMYLGKTRLIDNLIVDKP